MHVKSNKHGLTVAIFIEAKSATVDYLKTVTTTSSLSYNSKYNMCANCSLYISVEAAVTQSQL